MHRFYLPPGECQGQFLCLRDREAHHALRVLRIRVGERLAVLDGAGKQCLCEVQQCGREEVQLKVLAEDHITPRPYSITLVQAIPKGKLLEEIIQKGTELGVHRIIPIVSERTVVQLDHEEARQKLEKWRQVTVEAIKQCGCRWLPHMEAPADPTSVLARNLKFDLSLVGSLQPESRHPRRYFEDFRQAHGGSPDAVCIWIGPEGDFTADELSRIQAAGAKPISLGDQVLRSETAALYSLSIINYELQSSVPSPAPAQRD